MRPGMGRGGLLELEFPGLLVLRLFQVLSHTDILVMLVLDLCLHCLQLGVELGRDRTAQRLHREARRPRPPGWGPPAQHRMRPRPGLGLPSAVPTMNRDRLSLLHCGLFPALSQLRSASWNVQTGRDAEDPLDSTPFL